MSNLSKLELLKALITCKRAEVSGPDLRKANKAKAALMGLYRAKNVLQLAVDLDNQRLNIFNKAS